MSGDTVNPSIVSADPKPHASAGPPVVPAMKYSVNAASRSD
jgi:hypothetical protein